MQEAKQLDSRMRDTYSQLRRSAYDMGNTTAQADDTGGVRIKPPLSPSSPNFSPHARSHSREITLLENGMIVEHVDVRKEEREARERKKKDDRRARKSSRSSMMDVTSIISGQSLGPPLTDSGIGLKPYSRYSQASSLRPTSILTAPQDLPHAYSQASFSDVHSLGSGSPRRSRFFGVKNISTGWRSQDSLAPSGMSGSMVDMQCVFFFRVFSQTNVCTLVAWPSNESHMDNNIHSPPSISIHHAEVEYGLRLHWLHQPVSWILSQKRSPRKRKRAWPRYGKRSLARKNTRP